MPAVERYTGAWATPDLIGREAILQQIDAAIRDAPGPSVVALHGPGGIGKTRILSDALTRQYTGAIYPAKRLIDLYDIRYHSSLDLAAAIYESLDVAKDGDFRTFEKARDQQRKAQASGDVRQIAALTREALQAFVADLERFSQKHRVVIALDTLERVAYGASEQRPPFQVAPAWEWLIESLPAWGNVTLLIAGRNQIRHLFPALAGRTRLTPVAITPFTEDETNAYLEAAAKAAEVANEREVADTLRRLTPQRRHQVHEYSGGLPILLALLADYISIAGFGKLPEIFETGADLADARAVLEEQLIARMMEAGPIKDTLQILGRAPKGADAGLLAHLLGISLDEAHDRLDAIKRLSFVKVRGERFFLHDEMYAILQRQIYSAPDDAPEAERVNAAIIQWYARQINKCHTSLDDLYAPIEQPRRAVGVAPHIDYDRIATVQQEIQQLLIDQLSYHLRLNPLEGFREYVRDTFYAVFTGNTMLDIQLQAEILAFLDERDPLGEQTYIDSLEREVVLGVTALRPIIRLYTENDYDGVVREAQRLRQERPDILATAGRTTEAALDVWEALARTGRAKEEDSAETDRLLDAARDILTPVARSAAPDVSEARRWRAQSLLALMYHARGFSLRARGQTRPAIEAYRRAAALWRQVKIPICLAWTLNNLGFVEVEEGNSVDGLALIKEALEIRQQLGARALIGLSFSTLSRVLTLSGEYQSAIENAERALRLFQAVEYRLGMGLAMRNLAEALRRSVRRDDDPEKQARALHEAREWANSAYLLFKEIGDRPRQIEALIEEGCALRDLCGLRYDHPSSEDNLEHLVEESVQKQEQAASIAQETGNTYRLVDAYVNIASVGVNVKRADLIQNGLTAARNAIPDDYFIKRTLLPDPQTNPNIRNRQLFTQIARIHMLIGNRMFEHFQQLAQSASAECLNAASQEYASLAALFIDEPPVPLKRADDALDRAVYHYALAFEYDRLYTPNDPRGVWAQNRVYSRLKDLSAEKLKIIANAINRIERDYPIHRSVMRELLERRTLLLEEFVEP
ncbi:MAG: tetratricopeptide repeat protein [Roseiflexus sp.]|nr:tetratricopeptide repeat protein [Roseiflexus sp.]MCS7288812.1 tetratricopeptide repeat protein [Roseiflexus sp.]MDW8232313.1 tetratricopeptide repeat protein [Roseiflexaceae bacterium]